MRRFIFAFCALGALFALSSCGSELDSRGETLRIIATSLDPAFVNEPYTEAVRVAGGLSPYSFELSAGALPPGLSLQGGSVRGTPTEEGNYAFTITVSDGNLARTFQEYTLNVTQPPAATLSLNVPETEIQRPLILRAEVSEARSLQALRTAISWDPALFRFVPNSLEANSNSYALLSQQDAGRLQVDFAVLGGTLNGQERIFEFALAPIERTTLEIETNTEFQTDTSRHSYETTFEGVASDLSEPDISDDQEQDQPLDEASPDEPDGDLTDPGEIDNRTEELQ